MATVIENPLKVGVQIIAALTASTSLTNVVGNRIWPVLYSSDGDPEYPYITYGGDGFDIEQTKDGEIKATEVAVTIDVNCKAYDELPDLCKMVHEAILDYLSSEANTLVQGYKVRVGPDQYDDVDQCYYRSLSYTLDID